MKFLSVCSGIEAASVAWRPLGWEAVAFSEIEKFPNAVLAHHYPDVPNLGDMTAYGRWPALAPDLLVGGTPCQSFSVAGLRQGLADPRGNLALVFLGLVDRFRPRWVLWENVPGVRSADDGGALGAFLGGLGELGYGWAYRSLDAQYFGLAQRRERVFVVAHTGGWGPPAAVLFEPKSLRGDSAPSRETGERVAPTIASRPTGGGGLGTDFDSDGGLVQVARSLRSQAQASHRMDSDTYVPLVSPALKARDGKGPSSDGDGDGAPIITHALRADGFDASEDGTGRGTPLVVGALSADDLEQGSNGTVVAFGWQNSSSQGDSVSEHVAPTLDKSKVPATATATATAVRRLTPVECERLQGFPDNWTLVPYWGKPAADGPRYKALGNSMAVPVIRWIGQRMDLVESVLTAKVA